MTRWTKPLTFALILLVIISLIFSLLIRDNAEQKEFFMVMTPFALAGLIFVQFLDLAAVKKELKVYRTIGAFVYGGVLVMQIVLQPIIGLIVATIVYWTAFLIMLGLFWWKRN